MDEPYVTFAVGCENYMRGEWSKEPPTEPGNYATADRDGNRGPDIRVFRHPDTKELHGVHAGTHEPVARCWRGWWWTVAHPELPKPGKWDEGAVAYLPRPRLKHTWTVLDPNPDPPVTKVYQCERCKLKKTTVFTRSRRATEQYQSHDGIYFKSLPECHE